MALRRVLPVCALSVYVLHFVILFHGCSRFLFSEWFSSAFAYKSFCVLGCRLG